MRRSPSTAIDRQRGRALTLVALLLAIAAGLLTYWWLYPAKAPAWARQHMPALFVTETTLYRWQDEQGNWHVTDEPPADRDYEVLNYRSDANTLPPPPS